jgi:hypothetical protein
MLYRFVSAIYCMNIEFYEVCSVGNTAFRIRKEYVLQFGERLKPFHFPVISYLGWSVSIQRPQPSIKNTCLLPCFLTVGEATRLFLTSHLLLCLYHWLPICLPNSAESAINKWTPWGYVMLEHTSVAKGK